MSQPRVAAIIVNYNGASLLPRLADCLARASSPALQVVMVDNASPDRSGEVLPVLFPKARILYNRSNVGLARAINQALEIALPAGADFVLLLNPDTTFQPDFLAQMLASAGPRTLVAPKVLASASGRLAGHAGRFDWRRGLLVDTHDGAAGDSAAANTARELEVASFSCLLVPAGTFESIGSLDEQLGMYYEDTDFCLRARAAGYSIVYEPQAVVWHEEGGSSGGAGSPFAVYYTTRNRPYIVRKFAPPRVYARFTAYYLASRLARAAAYAGRRRADLLRAMLLAMAGFYRGRMGMTLQP